MTCDPCANLYKADDQSCHLACPPFSFQSSSRECASCRAPCRLCSGAEACLACEQGLLLLGQQCRLLCPLGYYARLGDCAACPPNCEGCNRDGCLACTPGHFLEAALCVDTCSRCAIKVATRGFETAYRDKEITLNWDWQSKYQPVFHSNISNYELFHSDRQITVRWSCNESINTFASIRIRVNAGRRDAEYSGLYQVFCLSR